MQLSFYSLYDKRLVLGYLVEKFLFLLRPFKVQIFYEKYNNLRGTIEKKHASVDYSLNYTCRKCPRIKKNINTERIKFFLFKKRAKIWVDFNIKDK